VNEEIKRSHAIEPSLDLVGIENLLVQVRMEMPTVPRQNASRFCFRKWVKGLKTQENKDGRLLFVILVDLLPSWLLAESRSTGLLVVSPAKRFLGSWLNLSHKYQRVGRVGVWDPEVTA